MTENEELKNILLKFNLELFKYIDSNNIIANDNDGYMYKINIPNIKMRNELPHLFRGNPFAIDNIKNYLHINNIGLILLSDVYVDCKHKLELICKQHIDKGIQYKSLDDIINGHHYCKYCAIEQRAELRRVPIATIKNRCAELDLIFIDRYIKNQETWITFKCKNHLDKGAQNIAWDHLKKCAVGCAYCTGRYKTTQDFIDEMQYINPKIEIIGEYTGSENRIQCRCKICEHKWSPIGRSLKYGQGCPMCTSSKGEMRVKQFLDSNKIEYIPQKTFDDCTCKGRLKFDFYLIKYNILIEFDGIQHYQPVDFANKGEEWANESFKLNQIRDKIKNDYCKNNGIKLIRIPYYEFNNIETILTSEISDVFLIDKSL